MGKYDLIDICKLLSEQYDLKEVSPEILKLIILREFKINVDIDKIKTIQNELFKT